MLCRVFCAVLLLTCLDGAASAETPPSRDLVRAPAPSPKRHVPSKARTRGGSAGADGAKATVYELIPSSKPAPRPSIDGSAHQDPEASPDVWSVKPKWSATNGGSPAAYGTRALVNELQANPSETTGYGAGAQVDFHF